MVDLTSIYHKWIRGNGTEDWCFPLSTGQSTAGSETPVLYITASWKLWAVRRARFSSGIIPNPDLVQAYYPPISPSNHYSLFLWIGQGPTV